MSTVNLYRSDSERDHASTVSIGWTIGLASWGLIFFTLIWGYFAYRLRAESWLEDYVILPTIRMAGFNTLVLLASSIFFRVFLWKAKQHVLEGQRYSWWTGWMLGMTFLVGQAMLWQMMLARGLRWDTTIAGSFFFLLTGFHALHMVGAMAAIGAAYGSWVKSERHPAKMVVMQGVGHFWDFLLVMWGVLLVVIFIVK